MSISLCFSILANSPQQLWGLHERDKVTNKYKIECVNCEVIDKSHPAGVNPMTQGLEGHSYSIVLQPKSLFPEIVEHYKIYFVTKI